MACLFVIMRPSPTLEPLAIFIQPPPRSPNSYIPTHIQLFALFRQSALRRETRNIDGDTAVMPGTEEAALRAAGAVCEQ